MNAENNHRHFAVTVTDAAVAHSADANGAVRKLGRMHLAPFRSDVIPLAGQVRDVSFYHLPMTVNAGSWLRTQASVSNWGGTSAEFRDSGPCSSLTAEVFPEMDSMMSGGIGKLLPED